MMAQIMNLLFGSDTQSINLGYETLYFADGLIDLPIAKLIGVCMAAVLAAGVITFMKYSRMGQAIRATAQDSRAARVMGIDTEKVYAFTFSLNSAICGAAGAIIVMVWVIPALLRHQPYSVARVRDRNRRRPWQACRA